MDPLSENDKFDEIVEKVMNLNINAGENDTSEDYHTAENSSSSDIQKVEKKTQNKKGKKPLRRGPSAEILKAKQNARRNSKPNDNEVVFVVKDHLEESSRFKSRIKLPTGVCFDIKMTAHYCLWDLNHPENPKRLTDVLERCKQLGLFERCNSLTPRNATKAEILMAHSSEHFEKLQDACRLEKSDEFEKFSSTYDSIYCNRSTLDAALLATGCCLTVLEKILSQEIQNGMAIIRPPGHHATQNEFCGYSFFNNVGIAAAKALQHSSVSKILIVDFDVHHGQGTQQLFYDDPRVLYFSTHRFENGNFWPNLIESDFNFIGSKDGIGFNCNVPLNKTGMGNGDFLSVWHRVLLPMAYQFRPDLVLVSAGYDAALGCAEFRPSLVLLSAGYDSALGDLKGEMEVTPQFYPHLLKPLMSLAEGRVAVFLEGGYCLKSLSEGVALSLKTLLGDPCPLVGSPSPPCSEITDTILNCTYMLKSKWRNMFLQNDLVRDDKKGKDHRKAHVPELRFDYNGPVKYEVYETRGCYPTQSSDTIRNLEKRLDELIEKTVLSNNGRVGLLYDDFMRKHLNLQDLDHVERPERVSSIFECLSDFGLVERCHRINSRKATTEELALVHSEYHVQRMQRTANMKQDERNKLAREFDSVFFNEHSYECALLSAGSTLQVVDSVLSGECRAGVAVVRPPGHHAEKSEPCGFCLFNNVAIAAKYAIQKRQLERVLILDWDVHFGNGIQKMFDDDPRVLYISIHRYDYGTFFPCSPESDVTYVGKRGGKGFSISIPWNRRGMGDTEYIAAFLNVILPVAYEFDPQLVLVSAGFDAADGDPLGQCKVTPECYGHMTNMLSSLSNGKVVIVLEGGYNLKSISYSMTMCTKALLGDPLPNLSLNDDVHPLAALSIQQVVQVHSAYWNYLKPFNRRLNMPQEVEIKSGEYGLAEATESLQQLKLNESDKSEPSTAYSEDPSPTSEACSSIPSEEFSISSNSNCDNESKLDLSNEASGWTPERTEPTNYYLSTGEGLNDHLMLSFFKPPSTDLSKEEGAFSGCVTNLLKWCSHVESVNVQSISRIDIESPCFDCGSTLENWMCLVCHNVYCSRFVNEHMLLHSIATEHRIVLSFSDLSVWCYACDQYLDNEKCRVAQSAAHSAKFGHPMPQ